MTVRDVSEGEMQDVISSGSRVLVEFYKPSCKFCQRMVPVLEEFAKEHPEISVVRIQPSQKLVVQHGLRSSPSWLSYEGGKKINQFSGATAKENLLKVFDPSFVPPAPPKPVELFGINLFSLVAFTVFYVPNGKFATLRVDVSLRICRSCID